MEKLKLKKHSVQLSVIQDKNKNLIALERFQWKMFEDLDNQKRDKTELNKYSKNL
jgi:hypothetical protein